MKVTRTGTLLLIGMSVVIAWWAWPARVYSEATAAPVPATSWDEAAPAIESRLGFTADYRAQWLARRWGWADEVDTENVRSESVDAFSPTTPLDLPAIRTAVAPLRVEFDALGNRFLDLLDEEVHKAWSERRYEIRTVDANGQATFPLPPAPTFYTSTIGHGGWAVQFALSKREVPELVQLDGAILEIMDRRSAVVRSFVSPESASPGLAGGSQPAASEVR